MTEHATQSYGNSEDINIELSNSNGRVSHYQYHSQWMAHWKRASSISAPQCLKYYNLSDASNKKDCTKHNTKSGEAYLASIGMKEGSTSGSKNVSDSGLNEFGQTLHVHHSAGFMEAEKGRYEMDMSMTQKDANTYDEVVVSDKLYLHKLPDSSINWENHKTYHFLNSEDVSFHFPMYDINRKIECILNPKKVPGLGQVGGRFAQSHLLPRETTLGSHVTEFAAKKLHFEARRMTKSSAREIEPCESVKGLQPFQGEFAASTSQPAVDRFEAQGPNMRSPAYNVDKKISSISDHILDGHLMRASFADMKHEFCNFTGHSRFTVSEMKGDNEVARDIRSSWSRIKCGSMPVLGDYWPGNFPLPSLVRENDAEYVQHLLNNTSNRFTPNVASLGTHDYPKPLNNVNGGSQNPSDALHHWLTEKKVCMGLSQGEQLIADSAGSSKTKGTALFEMLTVPATSRSHARQQGDSQPAINSSSVRNGDDVIRNEMHMTGTRKRPSAKTETMHMEACQKRNSLKGTATDRLQKDLVRANQIKSYSPAASPVRQIARIYATSSEKTSVSNKELSTPRTESMNVDQVLSHVQRSNISNSSTVVEDSTQAEHYNRWLNRLRHKPSEAFGLGTKRTKIGDVSTSAEMCSILSKARNHNTSGCDMTKCPTEQRIFDRTKHLPSTPECSYGPSAKEMQCWIQRWCHKTPQTAEAQENKPTPTLCEPENPQVLPDNFEGKQFPSIRAMALMGRAMNNFQTGKFQRKGSSVVWNMEDY